VIFTAQPCLRQHCAHAQPRWGVLLCEAKGTAHLGVQAGKAWRDVHGGLVHAHDGLVQQLPLQACQHTCGRGELGGARALVSAQVAGRHAAAWLVSRWLQACRAAQAQLPESRSLRVWQGITPGGAHMLPTSKPIPAHTIPGATFKGTQTDLTARGRPARQHSSSRASPYS